MLISVDNNLFLVLTVLNKVDQLTEDVMCIKDGSQLAEVVSGTAVPVPQSVAYPTGSMIATEEQAMQYVGGEPLDGIPEDVPSKTKPFSDAAFPVGQMEAHYIMAQQRGGEALSEKKQNGLD